MDVYCGNHSRLFFFNAVQVGLLLGSRSQYYTIVIFSEYEYTCVLVCVHVCVSVCVHSCVQVHVCAYVYEDHWTPLYIIPQVLSTMISLDVFHQPRSCPVDSADQLSTSHFPELGLQVMSTTLLAFSHVARTQVFMLAQKHFAD